MGIPEQIAELQKSVDSIKKSISELPDYSDSLNQIKESIAGLPDYSENLNQIKTSISSLVTKEELSQLSSKVDGLSQNINDMVSGVTQITSQIDPAKVVNIANALKQSSEASTLMAETLSIIKESLSKILAKAN